MKQRKQGMYMTIGISLLAVVCIVGILVFAMSMQKRSEEAIADIGQIYISDMSDEIILHFETNVKLRLSQIESIVSNNTPDDYCKDSDVRELIVQEGLHYGFNIAALMSEDGEIQMLHGDPIELVAPAPFLRSLNSNEPKVTVAAFPDGQLEIILGVSAEYPMDNGKRGTALIMGMPIKEIDTILALEGKDTLFRSNIVRQNGELIIKNADVTEDNYLDRIRAKFLTYKGKTPETYAEELAYALLNNEKYITDYQVEGEKRTLCCVEMPYSEWYLISIMPQGRIDTIVNELNTQRMEMFFSLIVLIIAIIAAIFIIYLKTMNSRLDELKRSRAEALEASRAKSEFLSNMSHDIRTPMNAILGMTSIAVSRIDDRREVENCLKKITLSGRHLLGLINNVLDMSKIESGKMSFSADKVSIREVIESSVNISMSAMREKGQHFTAYISDLDAEYIIGDSVRLSQVLINLLSNAVKFTPEGGDIYLGFSQEPSDRGEDFVATTLVIRDNGIGMSEEFRHKLFESFAREDNKRVHRTEGTGLGMAITKYIVDTIGGTIDVDSRQGSGTEFRIRTEFRRASSTVVTDTKLPDIHTLFICERNEVCDSASASLAALGISCSSASSLDDAEMLLKKEKFGIIIADEKISRADNKSIVSRLKRSCGDAKIVLMGDWGDENEMMRSSSGADGIISQLLFRSTLYETIKPFCGITEEETAGSTLSHGVSGMRVLVAEDNELNWEIASELLSEQGLILEHAENGQEAVDMLNDSEPGYYKAILMDVRMPIMNGCEATMAIRAGDHPDKDLPIIAMTADAFAEDIKRCLDSGMNAHISKPIDVKVIIGMLEKHVK